MHNCFQKEVFCSWQKIIDSSALKNENIYIEHIWYNPQIRSDGNPAFLNSYFNARLYNLIFFDSEGNFISIESLNNLHVNTNILKYAVLDRIGPYNIKEARIKIQAHVPNTNTIQFSR